MDYIQPNTQPDEIDKILYRLHAKVFLDGDVPDMDYVAEAKQALLQLLNEARIDENTISRDRFKEGWGKKWFESRIAQLTPKENK